MSQKPDTGNRVEKAVGQRLLKFTLGLLMEAPGRNKLVFGSLSLGLCCFSESHWCEGDRAMDLVIEQIQKAEEGQVHRHPPLGRPACTSSYSFPRSREVLVSHAITPLVRTVGA